MVEIHQPRNLIFQGRDKSGQKGGRKTDPPKKSEKMGYTKIFEQAGAYIMSDSCAALSKVAPAGAKVAATNSCKQAHYLPATLGLETWLGTTEQCVQAAITGRWEEGLK